jgi:hypothetical protein
LLPVHHPKFGSLLGMDLAFKVSSEAMNWSIGQVLAVLIRGGHSPYRKILAFLTLLEVVE